MVTRADIIAKAREAEAARTPWRHQGRTVPGGVDCVGLILWTCRELGITKFEPPPYPKTAQYEKFLRYFRAECEREVRLDDVLPGDILIFRQHIFPCHCGFATEWGDNRRFIHSYALRRRVVEERWEYEWPSVTRTAFRLPGVTD